MEGIVSKIKTKNKRAFTLTELLIVVIVIGVLSAVTLPKFNRVIENRKVTEAEEMMSAVRTEQERRCTLDQNYTTNFSALSDVIASANTKNYTYSLQAQGISAKSASGDYTLKILSYEDGSYCCTGEGCKKLNKNYPDCATLSFPASNCAGTEGETTPPGTEPTPVEPEEPECVNGQVTGNQVCNGCGTQTTKACVGGKWVNSLGACSKTAEECAPDPECSGTQPADAVKQCECGTVKASYKCDASTNYQWVQEEFPECPAKPADITETCSDGKTERTKAYTCVNNVWTEGDWDKECPEDCPEGQHRDPNTGECVGQYIFVPKIETIGAYSQCRVWMLDVMCQDVGLIEKNYPPCLHDKMPTKAEQVYYLKNPERVDGTVTNNQCYQPPSAMGGGLGVGNDIPGAIGGGPGVTEFRPYYAQRSTPTQYVGKRVSTWCPAGSSDEELCTNNCDPNSPTCSYECIKSASVSMECGRSVTSTVCSYMNCDPNVACRGFIAYHEIQFEPQVGSGKLLTCVAK